MIKQAGEFFGDTTHFAEYIDPATLLSLMKMGAKVQKMLEVKRKNANTVKSGLADAARQRRRKRGWAKRATIGHGIYRA